MGHRAIAILAAFMALALQAAVPPAMSGSSLQTTVNDPLGVYGTVNVKWHGAKGDGVNDTAALTAAPSAAEPNGSLYLRTTGQLYHRTNSTWTTY